MPSHFDQFCKTIAHLRGPDGCPWDREQNAKSLIRYLLEEAYEVIDAINSDDYYRLKEELGDLLLQIVLQAQLASEDGHFDISEVAEAINKKMIARHPHVFSDNKLNNSEEVLAQWEELKAAEQIVNKGATNKMQSSLEGVPETLPALLKALKISEKAVNQGFEWEKEEDIWTQLESELQEFRQEVIAQDSCSMEDLPNTGEKKSSVARENLYLEMGDILFTMVNIARWHKIDPEEALLLATEKFKKRFHLVEKGTSRPLKELSLLELNGLWQKAKAQLAGQAKEGSEK